MGHHLDRQDSHLVLLLLVSYGDLLVSLEAVREECLHHPYLATIDNTEGETDDKKEDIAEDEHSRGWWILFGKVEEHNEADDDVEYTRNYALANTDNFKNTNISRIPVSVQAKIDKDDIQNRNN